MKFVKTLCILVVLCVFAGDAAGQVTGRLIGSVVDPSGAAIPGAKIAVFLPGGERAVLSGESTSDGLFSILGVPSGAYDVVVEAQGFRKFNQRGVVITPAKETSITVKLEIGAVAESVEVASSALAVQTTNAEVSLNITRNQVQQLPVLNRSPQGFLETQAGVTNGRGDTTINGQRTSFTNVMMDGINIQDNFIRTNAVNFSPFVLLLDQVAEMTISTSNANTAAGGGASQVNFVTPSGSNQFHGSVFWQNRNNFFAANTWFNNQAGTERPFLNQHQTGGKIGGPVIKDKLLFYFNYEALRSYQQTAANRTILTADARQGIFTYRDTGGTVRKVNVLQAIGVQADPTVAQVLQNVPGPEKINNFRVGDSSNDLLRNTGGYSFNIRNNRIQDHYTGRVDYNFSVKNSFSGTYIWTKDIIDRPDVSNDYAAVPKVFNDDIARLYSVTWRWNPTPSITNELRGGESFAPVIFATNETFPDAIIAPAGSLFGNPLNTFRLQGRNPHTYNLQNNSSYVRGKHSVQFGYQHQTIKNESFNEGGITPTYNLGIGTGNQGLTAAQLAGASSTDQTAANNLLASLGGYLTSYSQTFNAKDRTSGFVSGAGNTRNFSVSNHAFYVQDNWKMRQRLTLNVGVRYEYFTRVTERDGLQLLPVLTDGNPVAAMASNATLDFTGPAVGRMPYNSDRNNFGPNIGLAWDVFGNGKTAFRTGYSINFVNDEFMVSLIQSNAGLNQGVSVTGVSGRLSGGLPRVTPPAFKVPRTFQDINTLSATSNGVVIDPNLRIPYVQQWNFGIQQEYKGMVFDIRYVGNHGTKLFRGLDHNQIVIRENGFLEDFLRAQSNGNLARARTGVFDPNYNASIPGSQPLTFFPRLPNGGSLNNSTNRQTIEQGSVADLASSYQTTRQNGNISFFPNPYIVSGNIMTNYSNSTYNGLQFDVRSRPMRGLQFQSNYTYSKILSDGGSGSENNFQNRNESMLDRFNPKLERSRAPFDLTHVIKGNFIYQIPAGAGHRFNVRGMDRVLGGWHISGIFIRQSGEPFSVTSGRGTFNRGSSLNTANTSLNKAQLDELFQFRMTPTGPYFATASAIGPDGRAVAADGQAPFSGQVFFQPGAGTVGGSQRRMFSGPWAWNFDFALGKTTKITENQELVIRMDSGNIFNHPSFGFGDQSITSTNFGKITGTSFGRRVIQFSAKYQF